MHTHTKNKSFWYEEAACKNNGIKFMMSAIVVDTNYEFTPLKTHSNNNYFLTIYYTIN